MINSGQHTCSVRWWFPDETRHVNAHDAGMRWLDLHGSARHGPATSCSETAWQSAQCRPCVAHTSAPQSLRYVPLMSESLQCHRTSSPHAPYQASTAHTSSTSHNTSIACVNNWLTTTSNNTYSLMAFTAVLVQVFMNKTFESNGAQSGTTEYVSK